MFQQVEENNNIDSKPTIFAFSYFLDIKGEGYSLVNILICETFPYDLTIIL